MWTISKVRLQRRSVTLKILLRQKPPVPPCFSLCRYSNCKRCQCPRISSKHFTPVANLGARKQPCTGAVDRSPPSNRAACGDASVGDRARNHTTPIDTVICGRREGDKAEAFHVWIADAGQRITCRLSFGQNDMARFIKPYRSALPFDAVRPKPPSAKMQSASSAAWLNLVVSGPPSMRHYFS